jgi:hypothetical protein
MTSPKICLVFKSGWSEVELAAVITTSTPARLAGTNSRQKSSARIVGFVEGVNYHQLPTTVLWADLLHVLGLVDYPVRPIPISPVSSAERPQANSQSSLSFPSAYPQSQIELHHDISVLRIS